jgi:hypothetical protein
VIEPTSFAVSLLRGGWLLLAILLSGLGAALVLKLPRAKPALDWIEFAFVTTLIGLTLAVWLGVLLAELRAFSLLTLGAILIGGGGLAVISRGLSQPIGLVRPARADATLVGLLLIAGIVYLRPHEFIFGAADAGVYVNMGATIARTGGLLVYDEEVARLDRAAYPIVFRELPPNSPIRYYQFPAYYLDEAVPGQIIPQFFAAQAVSIALLTVVGGVPLGLYATPIWGLLGVAAIYFFTRRLLGRRAALIAAVLLATLPNQGWFARYPTAEVLTQTCVFCGLYALTRWLSGDAPMRGWSALAGVWVGCLSLIRIDMILVTGVLVLAIALWAGARRWSRGHTLFTATLGLLTAHAVLHAFVFAWPYTLSTYEAMFRVLLGTRWPLWLAAGGVGVSGLLGGARQLRRLSAERRARLERAARLGVLALIISAAVYGYFLRPVLETPKVYANWYDGMDMIQTNQENLVRLGWYLTPIGLAAALWGVCLMVWRERSSAANLFVTIGLLSTGVYVVNILNNPLQIYASRRYVSVIFPALVVWGAYGLTWLTRRGRRPALVAALVVLIWWGGMVWQSRLIATQVDYANAWPALRDFERTLDPDSVVLMYDQAPVGTGDIIGTPLHFLFDHPVFVLRTADALTAGGLHADLERWRQAGRTVYVLGDANTSIASAYALEPASRFTYAATILQPTYTQYPDQLSPIQYDLIAYRLTLAP